MFKRLTAEQQIRDDAAEQGRTVDKSRRDDGRTAYSIDGGDAVSPGEALDELHPGGRVIARAERDGHNL